MASGGSGTKADALGSYGTATGQANNAYGVAAPIYQQMATNPQGLTPQQVANQTTASLQSLGGSNATAAGYGALASARTNNAGGYQAAIDDSARQAGAQQSQNVLGIQNQNAMLQRQQQQQGLAGLSNIYGTASQTGLGYLKEAEEAPPSFWQQLGGAAAGDALGMATSLGTGGASKALGLGGCWIAEAIYGADDRRTHVVRAYLNGPFRNGRIGDFIMRLYLRFGERIARVVKRSKLLKAMFRPFFDAALSSALEGAWI
jgi:hypothetical protein